MDSRLAHPFTCIVFGPPGSGKSVFTLKLIEHAQEIISQKIFDNYSEVEFNDEFPEVSCFDRMRILFTDLLDIALDVDKYLLKV